MAASAYSDKGEYGRAIRCREKTVQLASVLARSDLVASSWLKLALYAKNYGRFGNAFRYIRRASNLLSRSPSELDRSKLALAELELHTILMTPELPAVMRQTERVMGHIRHAAEQGEHNFLLGDYYAISGNAKLAKSKYGRARTLFGSVMRFDDAVRAAIGEWRIAIEEGNRAEAARLRRYVVTRAGHIEHVDIKAQLQLIQLADEYLRRANTSVLNRRIRECETSESGAQFLTVLKSRRVRLAVFARAGRTEEAVETAVEYHDMVRRAIANLPGEMAGGFLRSVVLEEVSGAVSKLQRAGDHAATARRDHRSDAH